MGAPATDRVHVRNTEPRDFAQIGERAVRLPERETLDARAARLAPADVPGGTVRRPRPEADRVVGMSASLIVRWECYDDFDNWEDFTADGMFTNHDPVHGRTMYGAEVLVDPTLQGHGIGGKLYAARRVLIERLGLPRIRGAPACGATTAMPTGCRRRIRRQGGPRGDRRPDPQLPAPRRLPRAGGGAALPGRGTRDARLCRPRRVAQPEGGRADHVADRPTRFLQGTSRRSSCGVDRRDRRIATTERVSASRRVIRAADRPAARGGSSIERMSSRPREGTASTPRPMPISA